MKEPAWVEKIDRHLFTAIYPVLRPGAPRRSPAWTMGVGAGSHWRYWKAAIRGDIQTPVSAQDLLDEHPKAEDATLCLLALALKLPLSASQDFFEGFAAALRTKDQKDNKPPGISEATNIYIALRGAWEEVEAMRQRGEGFDELLDWLTKKIGIEEAGYDVQRIQRLCHRIGLRLRRPGQRSKRKPRRPRPAF